MMMWGGSLLLAFIPLDNPQQSTGLYLKMSDKKETKKNLESSKRQAHGISKEEQSDNDPVSHMSPDSTNQSSRQSESPAVTTTVAGTNQPESIVMCAADTAGIHEPEITEANAPTSRSRLSTATSTMSKFYRSLSLSPKKNNDSSQSLQKSGLSVKSAASTLRDAMTGAASSLKGVVTDVAISVKGAIMPSRLSPERSSLVVTGSECEPPAKIAKKEFYCAIPTFVDRETKPKASGNLTESTSFTSSDVGSSLETDESPGEQTSPTEETPLLRTNKFPPSKEKSPKKE
ncbi:uncharacterized protein [Parasteatoda tepidariorum]|uniref:uncharacterized protein n=1 Tax=Parasteatoda tepidariorum TaxID=114398 RepID=UPI00077FDF2D|nr:uncharacterized protein LOC107452337 [Parasteatoda tepidariorum]